jgi:hypothetical protein
MPIGSGIPAQYDYINLANAAQSPSTVHCKNTSLSFYFRRYLLQKAMSLFKWNLPEHWSKDYFLYVLYCWGYIAVVNTDKFGVIPQACGLAGYNVFYQPTTALITNPLLRGTLQPKIGKQCTIIKLQPDYGGIMDIVGYYADMLALCSESVGMNLMNTHLSYVFAAGNKTAAESFKKMYDRVASGEVCTVIDKNLYKDDGSRAWEAFEQNLKQVYISSDILSDMRKIEAMFDTDIGIPNANTDKRERLVTDEVNANNIETASKCSLWLEQLQESVERTNNMFGTDISVEWRFPDAYNLNQKEGGVIESNNEPARAVSE